MQKSKVSTCNATDGNASESLFILNKNQLSEENAIQKKRNLKYILAGAVSLITFLTYLPCLRNEFLNWDDNVYVYDNPYIRSFNSALFKWAFLSFHESNWHPLTWISHALDYAIWGLNPVGHHLTNVILHTVSTALVVLISVRLIELYKERAVMKGTAPWLNWRGILITGGVTGLLFGLHPIHVESVAWVAERKDLLCALFFLLSIMTYIKYAGALSNNSESLFPFRHTQYLIIFGFFVLALLCKPMAVSLPAIMLILDWYPLGRIQFLKSFRTALVEKAPFITLSLLSSLVTIQAQKTGGAMELMAVVPLSARMLVAALSLLAYLWKMMVPINLIPYYPYPKSVSFLSIDYLLAIAVVLGITAACVVIAKNKKLFLAVWSYYLISLLPVLGIVQVGTQSMADRYAYLPSFGPFFIVGLGMAWVSMMVDSITKKWGLTVKFITVATTIFLFVSMAYITINQISIWKNSFTFWTYVIKNRPDEIPLAYNNRGLILREKGQLDKAEEDLDKAIALAPYYSEAYGNRGMIFMNLGQYGMALKDLNKAIDLNPLLYTAYNNRGMVFGHMGQLDRAIEDFNTAISLNQADVNAFLNRGLLFLQVGRIENAVSDLRNACELGNDYGCKTLQYLENRGN